MPDPKQSKQPEPPSKGLDGLQMVFLISACIGGFLSVRSPAVNMAQAIFRVAVVGVSIVGFLVVSIIKFSRNRPR